MSGVQAAAARGGKHRWAGLAGIGFVVLFLVGTIVTFDGQPDTSSAPVKIAAYYRDSGHRDRINIGWVIIVVAVVLLFLFLAGLRRALRGLDLDGTLTWLAIVGGTLYATLTLVAFSLNTAVKTMSDDTFQHQVFPSLIHAADDAAYIIYSSGGVGAALLVVASSLVARRAGAIAGWLGILGIIVGVISLFLIMFFPNFVLLLWFLAASVAVLRSGRGGVPGPEPAAAV